LDWLVVWTPLKNMSSSVGSTISNIWKNNTCSKPPNRWRILSHMSRSEPRDGPFDILNVNGFEPVQYANKKAAQRFSPISPLSNPWLHQKPYLAKWGITTHSQISKSVPQSSKHG
jgi:hypothetical protein